MEPNLENVPNLFSITSRYFSYWFLLIFANNYLHFLISKMNIFQAFLNVAGHYSFCWNCWQFFLYISQIFLNTLPISCLGLCDAFFCCDGLAALDPRCLMIIIIDILMVMRKIIIVMLIITTGYWRPISEDLCQLWSLEPLACLLDISK